MTLSRQLIVTIILLFVLVFAGTFVVSINNTRNFLINQLESHAQDTATSLGLSLSPHAAEEDLVVMGSMVDAIFDRGYYREIIVSTTEGAPLVERKHVVKIEGIPQWFIRAIPLATPPGEALLMAGWSQAGTVYVTSHPGYAYVELWENAVHTFWWFLGSTLVTLMLGLLALRAILQPVHAVEEQAEAICNREYPVQEKLPWARELRRMVLAMNRMSEKVKQMFAEQTAVTESLREQVYQDPVTGLTNRRYFDKQLQHLVESPEEFGHGALLMLSLHDFTGFNERHGYELGDELLRQVAGLVRSTCEEVPDWFAARLSGSDFAIVVSETTADEVDGLAQRLSSELLQLYSSGFADTQELGHIGVAGYRSGQSVTELLSEADMALRAAQSAGPNAWKRYEHEALEHVELKGATYWQDFLQQVVDQGNIVLHFQPVLNARGTGSELLHREVLLRVPAEDGSLMVAGVFMPMAERVGMARAVDKLAVTRLIDHISAERGTETPYAVNLTSDAMQDAQFVDWLCERLHRHPGCARRMVFEISEYGVLRNVDAMRTLTDRLIAAGSGCSIDHFGRGFSALGYLRNLKVEYLKVDGSYIRGIDGDKDNQFFLHTIIETAHGIDIKVIAEAVETQSERDTLTSLHIDGIQGYLVGKPGPLEDE